MFGRMVCVLAVLGVVGCSQQRSAFEGRRGSGLDELRGYMTGRFSSAEQHVADPENYYHIVLHMKPVWEERADGPWLYVEQAVADKPERPYRQRVYHLTDNGDGTYSSVVYELPGEALDFAGAHKDVELLAGVGPADLKEREGCTLTLQRRADGAFAGATNGDDCKSSLRGASYATSEAVIDSEKLVTWDRGFDADANQVWGATLGGYVFKREGR